MGRLFDSDCVRCSFGGVSNSTYAPSDAQLREPVLLAKIGVDTIGGRGVVRSKGCAFQPAQGVPATNERPFMGYATVSSGSTAAIRQRQQPGNLRLGRIGRQPAK